jgi:hypothetical protein
MENLQHENHSVEPSIGANTTTKAELFDRAKTAIEAGESSLRDAANAVALAEHDFNATQREIAQAVGKSVAWVNRLLQWQREGCQGTPFGPASKEGRERRKGVQATEQRASRKTHIAPEADLDDPEASARRRKAEHARQEADPETAIAASPTPSSVEATGHLKDAIDHWWPLLDDAGRLEITAHVVNKTEARVS